MIVKEVFKKLRLDGDREILVVNTPEEYIKLLGKIKFDTKPGKKVLYDFIQIFATSNIELEILTKEVSKAGKEDCLFWACYPKSTGKIKSDIRRETVWEIVEKVGMRCVSQIAIDETWSALRARPKDKVGK